MKKLKVLAAALAIGLAAYGIYILFRNARIAENMRNKNFVFNPNFGLIHKGYNITPGAETNAEGFRDTENFLDKLRLACGHHRIVILGSTGTFGKGVSISETLGPKLEARLKSMKLTAYVFNLSTVAQISLTGVAFAEAWLPRITPAVTIAAFGQIESFGWEEKFPLPGRVVRELLIQLKPEKKRENYLKALYKIARLTEPYGQLFILPIMGSSKFTPSTDSKLVFYESAMKEISSLEQKDFQGLKNVTFIQSLTKLQDPSYYQGDQSSFNPKGFDAVVDELAPLLAKELRKMKPEECWR